MMSCVRTTLTLDDDEAACRLRTEIDSIPEDMWPYPQGTRPASAPVIQADRQQHPAWCL